MDANLSHLVEDAHGLFRTAVRSVQADRLLGRVPWTSWLSRPLEAYRHVYVVGMGKAAMAMAGVVEEAAGSGITGGTVVVPAGYPVHLPSFLQAPHKISVVEGGHPVPGRGSVRAARTILKTAAHTEADDLLLVLISGGGSALCAEFAGGISLADAQAAARLLLESGADIRAVNTVRKHISRIGGGCLARAALPAEVLALVVSDVVGDDLSVIASGPTVPDPSTFTEAMGVLETYGLMDKVPRSVRDYLTAGVRDPRLETPKSNSAVFENVRTELVGTNRTALDAAAAMARAKGYATYVLSRDVSGEARTVGKRLAEAAREVSVTQPVCLLWGGETTVTVRGRGKGGRNQEVAVAAAMALEGSPRPVVLLSGGTDGRDGPTDAAGAWVTHRTAREARDAGLLPERYLADNDTYHLLQQTGNLLITGPTHTNVMDVQVALVGRAP